MATRILDVGKKLLKWYAIVGAAYTGAWLVDRIIRRVKGIQTELFPEGAGDFAKNAAMDFLFWPKELYTDVKSALEADRGDRMKYLPIASALSIKAPDLGLINPDVAGYVWRRQGLIDPDVAGRIRNGRIRPRRTLMAGLGRPGVNDDSI